MLWVFDIFVVPFKNNFVSNFFRRGLITNDEELKNTILLIILWIKIITVLKNCFLVTPKVDILKIVTSVKLSLEVADKNKKNHSFLVHSTQFGGLEEQILAYL